MERILMPCVARLSAPASFYLCRAAPKRRSKANGLLRSGAARASRRPVDALARRTRPRCEVAFARPTGPKIDLSERPVAYFRVPGTDSLLLFYLPYAKHITTML